MSITKVLNRIGITLVLGVLLLAGCDNSDKSKLDKEIVLYTSVPLKVIHKIKQQFESTHKGIKLKVNRSGTAVMMEKIRDEADSGSLLADIIWVADFSNGEELKNNGLLQRYQSPEAEKVFPLFKDKEGFYTGSRVLNMVIAYNTEKVKKVPESYQSLLFKEYSQRIGIVNPETSGTAFYTVSSLMQEPRYSERYFKELKENGVQVVNNNPTLSEKIAGGELYMGITIDFTVRSLKQKYPELPVNYVYPVEGTVAIASPIGLARDSGNPEEAKAFIDWVLSREGQTFMSAELGIVPVRQDVEMPPGMVPLSQFIVITTSPDLINKRRYMVLDHFRKIINE